MHRTTGLSDLLFAWLVGWAGVGCWLGKSPGWRACLGPGLGWALIAGSVLASNILTVLATKMGPWSWTPTIPENFKARRQDLRPAEKSEDSHWEARAGRPSRPRRI